EDIKLENMEDPELESMESPELEDMGDLKLEGIEGPIESVEGSEFGCSKFREF
ncbi:19810_t:CDS:2, partial [Racocetra fulgida]